VAASAIGPDVVPVDQDCYPLRPGILYGIDTRATQEITDLELKIGNNELIRRCGNGLSTQSIGPKILWIQRNEPKIYQAAHKFLTATSFLVARLTGNYWMDHLTAAWFAPMYDIHHRNWDENLCKGIIEPARLPGLAWAVEPAGVVQKKAADQTGLLQGTPVIVGSIDAAAEAVSAGVVRPGKMMLMYGSTLAAIEVLDRYAVDARLWSAPYLFAGTSCLIAALATSGSLTRWFRDQLAPDLVSAELTGGAMAYTALTEQAAKIPPGSEGVLVLPFFAGERTPLLDPNARGVFFGITLAHTRAHLFRAVLEGMGFGLRHNFEVMQSIGAEIGEITAVGGGTQNRVWLQAVSDITGVPQRVPDVALGASYGDAFLAGLSVGVLSNPDQVESWLKIREMVEPRAEYRPMYDRSYQIYRELYLRNQDLMHSVARMNISGN
jgi:xylulokinase